MCRVILPLTLAVALFPAGRAAAGWVTIKNETGEPIVVQEAYVVNNQVRKGKPVKLMPGDVLREYQTSPGAKTVHVFDCGGKKRTLCRGDLSWQTADQSFAVRQDGAAVRVLDASAPVKPVLTKKVESPRK